MNLGLLRNLTAVASGALARIEKQDLGRRDRSSSRSRCNCAHAAICAGAGLPRFTLLLTTSDKRN
jgi:hypothetical protein